MRRYITMAAAFALIAATISACNAEIPPNDAPTRGNDPRGASDTMQSQAASSTLACHHNKTC